MNSLNPLAILDGVRFTFSRNCCSGIVSLIGKECECWRCRKGRGLEPDEDLAAAVSKEAQAAMRVSIRQSFNTGEKE